MDSRGKLSGPRSEIELMIDSLEMPMMISSSKSLPRLEEGGTDKLDIDSRLFEANLG